MKKFNGVSLCNVKVYQQSLLFNTIMKYLHENVRYTNGGRFVTVLKIMLCLSIHKRSFCIKCIQKGLCQVTILL